MGSRVILVGFDGAEGLDLFGPAEVFTTAGRRLGIAAYEVVIAAVAGGSIALTSGLSVEARRLAATGAAHRVVYARRPGFQSQLGEVLLAQSSASDPLGPLVAWLRANLRAPLDVARLARRAGMSVRSLHRHCLQALDTTPAKLVEKVRLEQARTLLATTSLGTKTIAARCGFRT